MSNITLARAELAALLASVAPVRTGLAALETTSADLPVITIGSNSGDTVSPDQDYGDSVAYDRVLTVEYKAHASATYSDDLDDVLSAIREKLKSPDGDPAIPHARNVRVTGSRVIDPSFSRGGSSPPIAVLQVIVEIEYLD